MKWASVYHPFFKSFHRRQIYCALYHHRSTWHIGVTHGATRTRRRSASSPLISRAFRPCPGASASSASAPLRNGVVSVCWLYSAPVAFMSPLSLLLPLLLLLFLLLLLTCLIWFDFFFFQALITLVPASLLCCCGCCWGIWRWFSCWYLYEAALILFAAAFICRDNWIWSQLVALLWPCVTWHSIALDYGRLRCVESC